MHVADKRVKVGSTGLGGRVHVTVRKDENKSSLSESRGGVKGGTWPRGKQVVAEKVPCLYVQPLLQHAQYQSFELLAKSCLFSSPLLASIFPPSFRLSTLTTIPWLQFLSGPPSDGCSGSFCLCTSCLSSLFWCWPAFIASAGPLREMVPRCGI